MTESKPKLVYFDIKGRGEPIRLAFAVGGIPFDDERISGADFAKAKGEGAYPFGQLPVLMVEGKTISQSQALLRYAGKKAGLYPKDDDLKALLIDEIVGAVEDVIAATVPSLKEADEEKKMAMRKELAETTYPKWFGLLSKKMEENGSGPYFVGDSLTIADLQAYSTFTWLSSGVLDGVPPTILDAFPRLQAGIKAVGSHEKIKAWNESHQKK
ncbi:glutathione s-transferase [Nannochloropsis oceanica]